MISKERIEEATNRLNKLVPGIGDCAVITPPPHFWKDLSDMDFIVLYGSHLKFKVNERTMAMIDDRRKRLGLPQAQIKRTK